MVTEEIVSGHKISVDGIEVDPAKIELFDQQLFIPSSRASDSQNAVLLFVFGMRHLDELMERQVIKIL